jgi:uncharacterized membrane protein YqgA involved in biofilm formation
MFGTIVNVAAIIFGSVVGILFNRFISEKVKKILFQALGLSTLLIGIQLSLKTNNPLIVIFSLVIGGIIGETIGIEERLTSFGEFLKKKIKSKDSNFVEGFVSASLIFCVGAMAILGSIEDGINGNQTILYTKSLLDGITSIAFSSALGIGVAFSSIPIIIYQGAITFFASYIKTYLTSGAIAEMSATGGLLIIGISLQLLDIKKLKVSNLLPSIIVAAVLALIFV